MVRVFFRAIIVLILFSFIGCASIIKGGGHQGVQFNSEPPDAKITVTDLRNGNVVAATAKTPQIVMLQKDAGYFKYAKYLVAIEKDGYEKKELTIEGDVNGWYIGGNLIFGGLIGYLIVDPATGAMWTINPETVSVLLTPKGGADAIGFSIDEFKPPLTIEKLCSAIDSDKYDMTLTSPNNTVAKLNEILEVSNLYEKLESSNKLPKKAYGEVQLPPDIDDLKKQTADYRTSGIRYFGLTLDQQSKIKKLNRKLIEISYPNETPKKDKM